MKYSEKYKSIRLRTCAANGAKVEGKTTTLFNIK